MWTNTAGGNNGAQYGGDGFAYFDDQLVLSGVSGGSYYYDGQFCLRNVSFSFRSEIDNRNYIFPAKGNGKPNYNFQWSVPAGQRIVSITLTYGRYANTIQFTTDGGIISPILGTGSGVEHATYDVSQTKIRGVGGRAGDIIDQLKFYLKE